MTRPRRLDADAARFGAIVNRLRQERDWTLADLARLTGMNAIYLGVLERGENVPTLATILRLADALGVEAASLIHEVSLARQAARTARLAARKKRIAQRTVTSKSTETDESGNSE